MGVRFAAFASKVPSEVGRPCRRSATWHSGGMAAALQMDMTARRLVLLVILIASAARAGWRSVGPGVDYQEFRGDNYDIHVTRINVASDQIRIVVSNESDKGLKVSGYAKKINAVA